MKMKKLQKEIEKTISDMKHRVIKTFIVLCALTFTFQSCTDDLDQVNPNALTDASFWTNSSDLQTGLNAVYSAITDQDILGILIDPLRTDIGVSGNFRNKLDPHVLKDQTFDLSTNEVQNKWDALFAGIFRANQVIDAYNRLESSFISEESINTGTQIVAQARAIRGYLYFELHSYYNNGSVPIVETVPKSFEEFHQAFSTPADVLEFYRADLKFGMENLPATYSDWQSEGSGNLGRITGGACHALLAKSMMNENNFSEAKVELKKVIDDYGYQLTDNLTKNFTGTADFNSESIFELNYTVLVNPTGLNEESLANPYAQLLGAGNGVLQPTSWITLLYRNEKIDLADPANYSDRIDGLLYQDEAADADLVGPRYIKYSHRMQNSISTVDDLDAMMYGVRSPQFGDHTNATPHNKNGPNRWKKFTNWYTVGGGFGEIKEQDDPLFRKSGVNIPIIRLAEIYLLYAECMLEEGNLGEALKYINRIRKRSHLILLGKSSEIGAEFVDPTTTYMDDIDFDSSNGEEIVTIENLMYHLRFVEKPLELALEGNRSVDLRRWNVFKEHLLRIAAPQYDTYHYHNRQTNAPDMEVTRARYRCYITLSGAPAPTHFRRQGNPKRQEAQVRDALVGSQNYNPEIHGYFPIPQDEINSNLNWDKIK